MKKVKKKTTKIEKLLVMAILCLAILTPIIGLTISSVSLLEAKELSKVEQDLSELRQEVTELEVKRDEQLTHDQIATYAAEGGLEKNQERVTRVRVD